MLGTFMLLWAVAVFPVAIHFCAALSDDLLLHGHVYFHMIGLRIHINFRTHKSENGLDFVVCLNGKKPKEHSVHAGASIPKGALNTLKEKAVLNDFKTYFDHFRFIGELRVGLSDAAATALLCGAVNAIFSSIPNVHVLAVPDFRSQVFCLQTKCITTFCLGKLMVSAVIYLKTYLKQLHQKAGGTIHG